MTKAVHVSTSHPPFDTRIFEKECVTLCEAGYDVALVVPHDKCEVRSGVRISPLPIPAGRIERFGITPIRAWRRALAEQGDVYHLHDPELLGIGLLLSMQGRTVVFDSHENLPLQALDRAWIPRWLRRPVSHVVSWIETWIMGAFAAVVSAEDVAAARFGSGRSVVVRNYPSLDGVLGADPAPYEGRASEIAYVGDITTSRGALEMVRMMAQVAGAGHDARLMLGGLIKEPGLAERLQREPGWDLVDPLGWLERAQVGAVLHRARIGVVLLHPTQKYLDAVPVKLFEYFAAGVPVVASDFSSLRRYVDEIGAGIQVDPLDPTAAAVAVSWLLEHPVEAQRMGARGRRAVIEQFNWNSEGGALRALYSDLTGGGSPGYPGLDTSSNGT